MKWVKTIKKLQMDINVSNRYSIFKKEHLNKFYKEISFDKSNLFFMKSKIQDTTFLDYGH